jgi:hypothetical protein
MNALEFQAPRLNGSNWALTIDSLVLYCISPSGYITCLISIFRLRHGFDGRERRVDWLVNRNIGSPNVRL